MMSNARLFSTDTLLWQAFREGDVRAFEQMYRAHAGPLLTYGRRLVNNPDQVADAVQDIFMEVWNRRATLTTPTTIRFYLFRVLRNRLVGQLKRSTDPLHQSYDLTDVSDHLSLPSFETVLVELDAKQQQEQQLRQAIDTLPPRQQEALTLAYYHQFSNEEIAQLMGINPQSAINHLSRAINTLRKLLTGAFWLIGWLLVAATRPPHS